MFQKNYSNLKDHCSTFLCGVESLNMKDSCFMLDLIVVHAKLNPPKSNKKVTKKGLNLLSNKETGPTSNSILPGYPKT
jgi:hypothetical protein